MWIDSFSPAKNEFWVWLITMLLLTVFFLTAVIFGLRKVKK